MAPSSEFIMDSFSKCGHGDIWAKVASAHRQKANPNCLTKILWHDSIFSAEYLIAYFYLYKSKLFKLP